ncbi:prospero homeobox protein 2 [Denticeps clupeoides]|uniref:prospero homeobox protein 2 n=1 Tax=Denticeps clupeoides TaxID=299321 RepID=UPI0010A55E12|nr:prospero homeobox protein 1-like [Denticeps clupeoides]
MNLGVPDQGEGCPEEDKAELLIPCFRRSAYEEPLGPYPNGSVISHLLRKTIHSKRALDSGLFYADDQASVSSKDSAGDTVSPGHQTSGGPLSTHVQAKRARVENIIRGMAGYGDGEGDAGDTHKENKRKQKPPHHQESGPGCSTSKDEECHKLKEQLRNMERLLQQLQRKFLQVYEQDDSEHEDGSHGDEGGAAGGAGQKEGRNLQETLKCELSRAVSESVDHVFRKLTQSPPPPRFCQTPERRAPAPPGAPKPPDAEDAFKPRAAEFYESPEHQTEALSLVVRKTPPSQAVKRPYPLHQSPLPFGYGAPLHDGQILEHLLKYGPHASLAGLPYLPPAPDPDLPWDSLAMRPKVRHARPDPLGPVTMEGLCLPHVKMECGDLQAMVERSSYMTLNIQEGLTPNHLKKAKLMFFYTRYPSSNVLKTFFPDVKFNRCITSQLIKWFSNFREFYYIQVEKFARQAIVDGVNDTKDLSVGRESELFRALNMHYNKANDFQVPERFLEVAEITLQEFFSAISLAKDSDPSWKKAIYKVICKLDSDVPDEFKSSTCL